MAQMKNACRTWDMTVKAGGTVAQEKLKEYFDENCQKWVFQKERGESGYEHYQCRFTLRKKIRFVNLREKILEELGTKEFNISVTSKNCIRKNDDYYLTKEETRIEGPWKNDPATNIDEWYKNVELRPWQKEIVEEMENYKPEGRRINLIINPKGNEGKSWLSTYLRAWDKIYKIPPMKDEKDMMQFMMSVYTDHKPVFIDIPRGLSDKASWDFYAAVETIKGGYLYDTRYHGRDRCITPPCIYIFGNKYPDRNYLSWDRWHVRELKDGVLSVTTLFRKDNKKKAK